MYDGKYKNVRPIPNDKTTNNKTTDDKSKVNAILSTQSQKEVEARPPKESSSDHLKLLDIWNRRCTKSGLPKYELTFENRRQIEIDLKLLNLSENQFSDYIDKIMATPYLMGQISGHKAATFDWIIKQQNYLKVIRGNYAPRDEKTSATNNIDEEIIKALADHGRTAHEYLDKILSKDAEKKVKGHWCKMAYMSESNMRKYLKKL